jgi:ABC-type branched-subunit amino acid transport system substrate-binding protein
MKKFSLLLVLFLFGCQSLTKKPEVAQPLSEEAPTQTHQQFESRDLITQKVNEKKVQVALFFPFSGKNKELGWSLFNSATLSLFENDLNHNIELVLIDSKDTAQESSKAFKEIINRKIKVVIGPIFSSSIEAIAQDAKDNNIAVISLSNNQQLMGKINKDGGIFLAGMMPEIQIDKIVNYAMDRGKFSFAVIAPNNQYGKTITDLFKKIVRNRDGNFITSEFYDSNSKDLDRVVERVINSFSVPSRLTAGKNKLKKDAVINESDHIYPQVILIPESGKILSKIVASIKKQNIDERDFQIVGTSQWDDVSTLNDSNLIGAWFASPENEKFRNFEKAFYQTYSRFPPRISSIAYDTVAVVAELVDRKKGKTPMIEDFTNYNNPPKNGFEGIDGLFRFLPNGLVQRNLAVLGVGSGRFETLEKPVEQFLKY